MNGKGRPRFGRPGFRRKLANDRPSGGQSPPRVIRLQSSVFGYHLSIAGGMHNALLEAEKLGCDTTQVFTKNQQQWKFKPLEKPAVADWATQRDRLKFEHTVSHNSYLINLASPDDILWQKSIDLMVEELARCDALRIPYLVSHPGAHTGSGIVAGIRRIAAGIDSVHKRLPRSKTILCLEATAGQGSVHGSKLEELAMVLEQTRRPARVGVCLDTAHLFAAGYDFRGRRYPKFRRLLEATVGVANVKVLHLNDSKKPLGSRVDRHEHIGHGTIGLDGFRPFVRDKAFRHVPKIMETPKGVAPDGRPWDVVNLETLRSFT